MVKAALLVMFIFSTCNGLLPDVRVRRSNTGIIILSGGQHTSPKYYGVPRVYLNKIIGLAQKYKVSSDLIIAVARAESNFNPFAVSHKGAVGIMQVMGTTAEIYGVRNLFNVDKNLEAGIKHLKYLLEKYNNSIPLVLAAYNAGENAVKKYGGVPPFKETKNYVVKVMRMLGLSQYENKRKIIRQKSDQGKEIITS